MEPILQAVNLHKSYSPRVQALAGVSFDIGQGECLGLVGESGSGKSTLAKLILGLEIPDSGEVRMNGVRLQQARHRELKAWRRQVQMVFQDPYATLNPRLPIHKSILEPLENFPDAIPSFLKHTKPSAKERAAVLLEMVGLSRSVVEAYPHQLSGGQRQRVAIARGLSIQPKLLLCDEPTSSLDVSVQAQILNLLQELKEQLGMSYLFISHDIASVRFMSDRIGVLREGRLVDLFPVDELLREERDAYTRRLVEAASL